MIYYFCLYMYQQSPKIVVQKYEYNKIIVEVQKYMIRHIFLAIARSDSIQQLLSMSG